MIKCSASTFRRSVGLIFAAGILSVLNCSAPSPNPPPIVQEKPAVIEPNKLIASFYGTGDGFQGKRTANGEIFDTNLLTAAHRTYPFGTRLRVTNPANGKSVVVRINDRGPYRAGRALDLSTKAARELEIEKAGISPVEVELLLAEDPTSNRM